MRIGELADSSGVTTKTIRYYEQIGVLGEPERTASGYRDYGEETVDRLAFVKAAQAVGLTLAEIREVLAFRDRGEAPCEHVYNLLGEHAEAIDEQMRDLEALRSELRKLARRARRLDPRDCDPSDVCHLIPRQ